MKNFDFLGKKLTFFHNNNETITSAFGGVISLFTMIILILLILSFGNDFFYRKNPSVVSSTKSPDEYTKFYINNKNFSFALQISNFLPNQNTTLFYPLVTYQHDYKDENNDWKTIKTRLKLKTCTEDMFYNDTTFFKQNNLNYLTCPIFDNLMVGGYVDGTFAAKINIEVYECLEGKTDLNGNICESDEKKNKIFSEKLSLLMYYQNILIEPDNYDNGLKRVMEGSYYNLDKNIYKNPYYFFQNISMSSDYGWLIESKDMKSYLGFKTKYMDVLSFDTLGRGSFKGSLTRAVFYFSKDSQEYQRNYVKIQSLAAQVGGIIKIIMIAAYFMVDYYNLFKIKLELSYLFLTKNEVNEINTISLIPYPKNIFSNNKLLSNPNNLADKAKINDRNCSISQFIYKDKQNVSSNSNNIELKQGNSISNINDINNNNMKYTNNCNNSDKLSISINKFSLIKKNEVIRADDEIKEKNDIVLKTQIPYIINDELNDSARKESINNDDKDENVDKTQHNIIIREQVRVHNSFIICYHIISSFIINIDYYLILRYINLIIIF